MRQFFATHNYTVARVLAGVNSESCIFVYDSGGEVLLGRSVPN